MQNIQVVDGSKTTGTRYFNGIFGFDSPAMESWDCETGTYSTTLGEAPDGIKNWEEYIKDSFRWAVYPGVTDANYHPVTPLFYPEFTTVKINADQYEQCGVKPDWKIKQQPIVDPPVIYKYYKSICGVRADEMKDGNKITWNRVVSAQGYIIYRYDSKIKKYKKIGTRTSPSKAPWTIQNTFTDINVAAGKGYSYRVSSYKYVKGKLKISKKSGAASIIYRSNKYGNATRVKLSRTKAIKGKVGTKVKLKANISFESGKKPYSKTVRWYTNNKKIATVSKSGVVKLRAKGKCALYAKAHNGVKSKKLVVQVI